MQGLISFCPIFLRHQAPYFFSRDVNTQAESLISSTLFMPEAPERILSALQPRQPASQPTAADAEIHQAAAKAVARALRRLCAALALVRRTAVCLRDCGIRVAFLYLNHMLMKLPRCA